MDYSAIIKALRVELEKLDHAIAQLQSLTSPDGLISAAQAPQRRGRKSMGTAEREQVSIRMKRYWAQRSKQKK